MSGGHFVESGYPYYRVMQFADELQNEVDNNDAPDAETGYCPRFSPETLAVLRAEIPGLRRLAEVMRVIDYLYSGDHDEDSFARAMQRIEVKP